MLPSRFRHQPRLETIEEAHSDDVDLVPDSVPTHASGAELPHHELPSTVDLNFDRRDGSLTPSAVRVIARNNTSQSRATNEPAGINTSSDLPFTRPVSAGEELGANFKYAQAIKPQLDFTGSRKGPAAGVQLDNSKPQPKPVQAVLFSNAADASTSDMPQNNSDTATRLIAAALDTRNHDHGTKRQQQVEEPTVPVSHEQVDALLTKNDRQNHVRLTDKAPSDTTDAQQAQQVPQRMDAAVVQINSLHDQGQSTNGPSAMQHGNMPPPTPAHGIKPINSANFVSTVVPGVKPVAKKPKRKPAPKARSITRHGQQSIASAIDAVMPEFESDMTQQTTSALNNISPHQDSPGMEPLIGHRPVTRGTPLDTEPVAAIQSSPTQAQQLEPPDTASQPRSVENDVVVPASQDQVAEQNVEAGNSALPVNSHAPPLTKTRAQPGEIGPERAHQGGRHLQSPERSLFVPASMEEVNTSRSSIISPSVSRPGAPSSDAHMTTDTTLHRVSTHGSKPRVTKAKAKPKPRPTGQIARDVTQGGPSQAPTTANVLQLLAWTVQEEQHRVAQSLDDQWKIQDQEILSLKASKQSMQIELEFVKKENERLTARLQQYKEKLQQASKLQNSIADVGNDLIRARDDSKSFQQQYSELVHEGQMHQKEGKKLEAYFVQCVETSTRIKDNIKKACAEADTQIRELGQKNQRLDEQLKENAGFLEEERNRRLHLEKQLEETNSLHEHTRQMIEQKYNVMTDKLYEIHAAVELASNDEKGRAEINQCLELLQSLKSASMVAPDGVKGVEDLVRSLTDSLSARFDQLQEAGTCNSRDRDEQLQNQMLALKSESISYQSLQAKMTELQASSAVLSERLTSRDDTITSLQKQLRSIEDKEAKDMSRIAELEDEVRILNRPSESDESSLSTRELELQNPHLRNALDRAKAELTESAKKLQLFEETEHSLREEVETSKTQLQQIQNTLAKMLSEKAEMDCKISERLNNMRTELSKQANKLRQEQAANFQNKSHQIEQKRKQAEDTLAKVLTELESSKQQVQLLAEQARSKDEEIQQLRKAQAENREKLGKLQEPPSAEGSSEKTQEIVITELHAVNERLHAKEAELQLLKQDQKNSTGKMEALQKALSHAERIKKEQESSIETLRERLDAALEEHNSTLHRQQELLATTETAKREADSNMERLRKKTETILKEHQEKATRDKDCLHRQLAEADTGRKDSEIHLQRVRREAEDTLKKQQEKNRADLGELQRRVNEAEKAKRELEASIESMHANAQAELSRVRDASERERNISEERARRAEAHLEELKKDLRDDLEKRFASKTPSQQQSQRTQVGDGWYIEGSSPAKEMEPPKKPRRKVDRSSNSVINVSRSSQSPENSSSLRALQKEQHIQLQGHPRGISADDDFGRIEVLDENDVPAIEQESDGHKTRHNSTSITTFHELNQSMGFPLTSLVATPPKRTSSPLSDAPSMSTPSGVRVVETPQDKQVVHDEARVLRELTFNATTPIRAPPMGQLMNRTQQSSFRRVGPHENPFFDIDRPKSQAPPNTASRMTPSTHQVSRPNCKPAATSSSPDFVQKEASGSHRVTTYGHTPNQKQTHSRSSKRRASAHDSQTELPDHKRQRGSSGKITRRPSDHTLRSDVQDTQPESQELSTKQSQSQRHPLSNVPMVGQSRMRSSTQLTRSSSGGAASRRGSKKSEYAEDDRKRSS